VWFGACAWRGTAFVEAAAAAAIVAEVAARAVTAAAVAKSTAAFAEPAAATAFTEAAAAAWRGCWCRTFELEFCSHRLAAVLRKVERETLAFRQRLRSKFRQRGDMHEHICAAAVRKNETKALSLIEPLNSPRFPHCQSLSPCESISMPSHPQAVRAWAMPKMATLFPRINSNDARLREN
jgi:hypothetical protein